MAGTWQLPPETLVETCRSAERAAGSPRDKRGAARYLDVDILFFGELTGICGEIELPHPRMHLRDFVLVPLSQVWPDQVPGLGRTPSGLLADCPCDGHIIPVNEKPPPSAYWSRENG
jgi:2-amino-4-hydroxy-6-hydroxymethyldihydropteridine diphosphokinase